MTKIKKIKILNDNAFMIEVTTDGQMPILFQNGNDNIDFKYLKKIFKCLNVVGFKWSKVNISDNQTGIYMAYTSIYGNLYVVINMYTLTNLTDLIKNR